MKKGDMKKFVIRALIWGAACVAFTLLFCILVDPYNVFHPLDIRDNGVEPDKNYIKMVYILDNPQKFDSYMFGSSRVSSIHTEKLEGEKCYNMTYSSAAVWEHLDNVKTMIADGVNIKKIYVGLDSMSYTMDVRGREDDPMRQSYEYALANPVKFWLDHLDTANTFKSLNTSLKHQSKENFQEIFYEYGWSMDYDLPGMDYNIGAWSQPSIGDSPDADEQFDKVLECTKELKEICDENDIELVVFLHPMLFKAYVASKPQRYQEFMRELAQITDYYNFSGVNDVTVDYSNYTDPSHYTAQVGDILIDFFNNGTVDERLYEQGFGWHVDADNVDELIDVLNATEKWYSHYL